MAGDKCQIQHIQQLHNSAKKPRCERDPRKAVLRKFHKFLKVFVKKESEKLPPRHIWDHKIELKEDFNPKQQPVYHLPPREQDELNKFIKENL